MEWFIEHLETERHCTKNRVRNKAIIPTFRNKNYREEEQGRKRPERDL